jgi:D-alanyl-lipoteichoic acid acyltransferase DltB (MBOAT superfamily)
LQIYADFGGYSDLARGTARLLGIRLMENFDAPYAATNLAQYWQRWHISLSSFLEDYLHRPLAFALRDWGEIGAVCAIWVTFLTSGLWHGTGWTFVIWGALHAAGLSVYMLTRKLRKRLKKRVRPRLLSAAAWLVTFHYVCFGYAFFRAKSVSHALTTLQHALSGWRITDDVSHSWMAVAFYAAVTLLLDRAQRRGGAFWIFEQKVWVRALCYGALSMAVVRMFAPNAEFIYAEF